MVQSMFSLNWDSYKSNICSGFSSLQQNGEFVDMTIAADGHFVKVHQVLLALVSPYLKELISSAPCQHPVIFLNNVSYKTLSSLLEYVYAGEVLISSENLTQFMETAKSLCIRGLENVVDPESEAFKMEESVCKLHDSYGGDMKTCRLPAERGVGEVSLPVAARKILLKRARPSSVKNLRKTENAASTKEEDLHDYSELMDDSVAQDSDDGCDSSPKKKRESKEIPTMSNLQYSVSIRGALQVILNRYIYNIYSKKHRSGIRRWRCVDYRNRRCPAYIVTKGNVVLTRGNLHNHSYHDKKILQKIEKKGVFSALQDIQDYKEKEQDKDSDNETSEKEEYAVDFEEGNL